MSSSTVPPPLNMNHTLTVDNASQYSLDSVHHSPSTPLVARAPPTPSYGSATTATFPRSPGVPPNPRRVILNAALKMAAIFAVATLVLGGTLYLALPTLEEDDRPLLKIPKSFAELQALNTLLKKYRDIYPTRILVCYIITYLFLQAFSLPGSMYLSILGGAVYGVPRALPLACACVATGASLCYLLSAALGPALLTLPFLSTRLARWSTTLESHKANLLSFLIVLRIAPLPPHWVVNVLCPHVGIGLVPFWISTFLGIFGVTVIHTTIGGGLDEMTSADDFHLISWRNFLGLGAIVVGVLIPVFLRYFYKRELAGVVDAEAQAHEEGEETSALFDAEAEGEGEVRAAAKGKQVRVQADEEFYDSDADTDDDEDIILEAGPSLDAPPKPKPKPADPNPNSNSN